MRVWPFAQLCVIFFLSAVNSFAEKPFDFQSTPGELPKQVVPTDYAIRIVPNVGSKTFTGTVIIKIKAEQPVRQVVMNALELDVTGAMVDDQPLPSSAIKLEPKQQLLTLHLGSELPAGEHAVGLSFTGKINQQGQGLFYADYQEQGTGAKKTLIGTQFEATDARRMFPCWDEPSFRARFQLTVAVPPNWTAVSNMPVDSQSKGNLGTEIRFAATPPMPSYLNVLAAGELDLIETHVGDVQVRVVTTKGKAEYGRYALESSARILQYYNEYFGVPYPLPKLDNIALPGGFGGAMENWGGITYFESALLFDPEKNSDQTKHDIFAVIAHEMAHMWFGDLVTMAWWDNLWLNEGFASWMGTKCTDHFNPQWNMWLNGYGAKQFAMALDARRTSHPIQQPIANESEAMIAFDAITYNKGQALIRMLENYLGEGAFRDGIRAYMAAHAYGNTTTADLWRALERAGHKPVTEIAASFTEQDGVPLISAETACNGDAQRLTLRQGRFVVAPARTAALPSRNWQIPVAVGKVAMAPSADVVLLNGSTEVPAGFCGEAIKVNLGDIGYYRVEYGPASMAALTKALPQMSPSDRVNFLADGWAMVQAGRAEPSSYLALVENVGADDRRPVWDQIVTVFSALNRLSRDRPERPALQRYISARLRPVFDRLGWDGSGSGDDDDTLLRGSLIWTLGELGDEAIIAEAKRRFAGFLRDPQSLPAALRDSVTHVVGITADRAMYDTLLTLARKSTVTNERLRYYFAAAAARDPALARATLDLALGDEVPSTIVTGLIGSVASSGEQPELAWDFLQKNYDALFAKQGPQFRDQFVANFMTNFSDEGNAAELAAFAPVQVTSGGRVMAGRAQEVIKISADLKTRALPAVDTWIRERK